MKKKQSKARIRNQARWRLVIILLFVLLFAGVGTYRIITSFASSATGLRGNAALYGWTPSAQPLAGDTIRMHWHLSIGSFGDLDPELPFTTKWTATPDVSATNVSPTSGQFVTDSNFAYNQSNHKDVYITVTAVGDCGAHVDIRMSIYGKSGALVGTGRAGSGPSGGGTNCYPTPDPNPTPNPTPSPDPGPDPGPGPGPSPGPGPGPGPGRGNDPGPGQGPSPGPTGGSGGGGGSTAQRQADKPNPLPTTANRGTTKQPKLEPSPFFDGKQYARGSESDNYTIGTILSNTGRTVAKGLPFAIGAVAIAGTGFAVYWRVWRKH